MAFGNSSRSLVQLPAEIILAIAEPLDVHDLNALLRSSRYLASLLHSRFYRLATNYTFRRRGQRKSPLTWAAENGRAATVQKLLDAGADATSLVDGLSPFHYAVQKGHTEIARLLLDAGANPTQLTRNGDVPLIPAAEHGHVDTVRLLLEVTNTNTPAERLDYRRALLRAVYFGHLRLVQFMLDNAISAPSAGDGSVGKGWLDIARDHDLIYQAARSGHCDIIRLLLDYGAKVPPVHRRSTHPLVVAAQNGHKDAVQLLIAARADPTYEEKQREAASQNDVSPDDVAQFLLDSGAETHAAGKKFSAMMSSAQPVSSLTVRLFQKYGKDLVQPTKDGRTPLQIALEEFSPPDVIHLLLELGADVNIRGHDGSTALHTLVRLKRHDLLETFLSAGASLKISDNQGNTPLLLAVAVSNVSAASLFLQYGADVSVTDSQGRTPLHLAASHTSGVILSMLLNTGADISVRDRDGRIPLHFATLSGNPTIFKALLSRHDKTGIDPLVRSQSGRTVLELAVEGGHMALVELLVERGVDINSHWEGYSALHSAVANKHPEITEYLLTRGADPLRLDFYGRTPFDWASGDGTMLNTMVRSCDIIYRRTNLETRMFTLKDSVVRFGTRILHGQTSDFYKLAKCLIYLNNGDAALSVFRQAAKARASEEDLRYPMCCSGCRKRFKQSGRSDVMVLVCRRCHDLELCDFVDTSPFLGFYSTDAGFAVDPTPNADKDSGNATMWKGELEELIERYS